MSASKRIKFTAYMESPANTFPNPAGFSSAESSQRINFVDIVDIIDSMLSGERSGGKKRMSIKKRNKNKFVSGLIDRHSTWF